MSIMKTIMFPGDTEPREIQDSRIEIITIGNTGTPSMTYDEAYEFLDNNWNAMLYLERGEGGPLAFSQVLTDNCDEFGCEGLGFYAITPIQTTLYNQSIPLFMPEIAFLTPNDTIEWADIPSEFLAVPVPWTQGQETPSKCVLTMHFNESDSSLFYGWDAPIADADLAGMVKAIPATSEMTEYIGIDDNGQLRVAPSNDIETDETLSLAGYAADAQVVGNKLSSIPISIAEDGYTEINGLRQAVSIDIAKTDTQVSVVTTLESGEGEIIQNSSIIALNASGLPIKITTNETECVINWGEGF